ncbi:transcription antitermination factor NusB [Breznakiellaceae bacterium SP9]
MSSRRKGRIVAFQALYSWEACAKKGTAQSSSSTVIPDGLLDFAWLEHSSTYDETLFSFARVLVIGTIENIQAIDRMIEKHLQNWDFSRLNRVDLAILRMSTYTLMFQADMSPAIVINEAIGICEEYGCDDSYRFINGVLDSIRKTIEANKAPLLGSGSFNDFSDSKDGTVP